MSDGLFYKFKESTEESRSFYLSYNTIIIFYKGIIKYIISFFECQLIRNVKCQEILTLYEIRIITVAEYVIRILRSYC